MTGSTALNETRRATELAALADGEKLDVIVIGGVQRADDPRCEQCRQD